MWQYKYPTPRPGKPGGMTFVQNRGVAVSDGKVFFGTTDNFLVALDQKTGAEQWKVSVDDPRQCGCDITAAPLIVKDKVIVGGNGRRRRASRLFDGVLCQDRPPRVALVRDSRARRKGSRDVEGR